MKFWQYCIILFIYCGCSNDKKSRFEDDNFNEIIYPLKVYNISETKLILDVIPESLTKNLIKAEYNYLQTGETSDNLFKILPKVFKTKEEEVFYNYSYGDYLFRKSQPIDTLSFKYYLKAYSISKEENNNELTIETLKRINNYFKKYNLGLNDSNRSIHKYQKYQNELSEFSKDSCDIFWANYYDIHLRMLQIFNKELSVSSLTPENFQFALNISPEEPYFKGILYQLQGIYYTLLRNDPVKGSESNNIAKKYYLKSNIFPSKRALFGLNVNKAIADVKVKNYEIGIDNFKTNLSKIPTQKSYHFERQFTYEQLSKVFIELKEIDSVNFYQNLAIKYKDSIKSELLVLGVHEIEKRPKVKRLQKLLIESKRYKIIFGAVIGIILLLTLYSLYRWFKVDKVNKVLNTEKKQTHEELIKVRQLVIKDSITLKNKTKVLLEELIYIKVDDHYLLLYTSKGKKEFVRGKIKDIIKKLPPNFKTMS